MNRFPDEPEDRGEVEEAHGGEGLAEVRTAEGKLYLYVVIDRTSKCAFVQLVTKTGRTSASAFLSALIKAVPYKIHTVLTDNGIQFTFPPRYADGPTARYMIHMFGMRCRENGIKHRLTKIKHPWTNGQVERMNRTIKAATVKRYHYDSHVQLTAHLHDFIMAVVSRLCAPSCHTNTSAKSGQPNPIGLHSIRTIKCRN